MAERAKGKIRAIWKLARALGSGAIGSGGIDDTKLPSGFEAPYRRGSRMVRNLWHIPF
jgi:hypothetical protein